MGRHAVPPTADGLQDVSMACLCCAAFWIIVQGCGGAELNDPFSDASPHAKVWLFLNQLQRIRLHLQGQKFKYPLHNSCSTVVRQACINTTSSWKLQSLSVCLIVLGTQI